MIKLIKTSSIALAAILMVSPAFAQDQKRRSSKDQETQEIIIRKKNANTEKMTIVVEGDNVTINGKPVDDYKNNDVTILRRDRSWPSAAPQVRNFSGPRPPFEWDGFDRERPVTANKAMLGVMTQKADDGVKVTEVTKESAAEKAGLQKDDVITSVASSKVTTPQELVEAVGAHKPNDKVEITYKRNGKENKTTATLGENKSRDFSFHLNNGDFNFDMGKGTFPRSEDFNFNFNRRPKIGLQIQDLEEGKGVSVKDVDGESPAAKAGLKEGDVITQVNGKDVTDVDALRNEIRDVKEGDTIKFNFRRDGKTQTVEIKMPKRLKSADL